MRVQLTTQKHALRPATTEPSPPKEEEPVYNTQPDRLSLRHPERAVGWGLAGMGVGAILGSLHSFNGALIGGLTGGLAGTAWGAFGDILTYDAEAKLRQGKNRWTAYKSNSHQEDLEQPKLTPLGKAHLRAVDPTGDAARAYDGFDSSRDMFAFYSNEGPANQPYQFQLEFNHLRAGAQKDFLEVEFQFTTAGGAKAKLKVDDEEARWNGAPADIPLAFEPKFGHLRLDLPKEHLRALGWQDGQALKIEAVSRKPGEDGVSTNMDHMSASTDGHGDFGSIFRWEGKTIYYAITDRFNNGDPTNDAGTEPGNLNRFQGGDWQGVIDKLDYLKDLGVDCVWLSCPYQNDRDFFGSDGYHGYWPHDFEQAEASFGSKAKLKELTEQAHARGMKVMMDVVVNHTGYNHPWVTDPDKKDWFHKNGDIGWVGLWAMENQALSGLPDLAHENPQVRDYLTKVHLDWLKDTGIDAFRMDAVRHVPEDYLRDFNETMRAERDNFFSIGEAFWLDPNFVSGYQNRTQESMFDFKLAFAIRNVFSGDPNRSFVDRLELADEVREHHKTEAIRLVKSNGGESMKLLSEVFEEDDLYDNPKRLGIFVDNHDMMRFLSDCGGDLNKLKIALAFVYACRGNPCLYYGTEVGMDGWGPENRKPMEWGKNPDLTDFVGSLTAMRSSSPALAYGTQKELMAEEKAYALARIRNDEQVVCAFNNSEEPQTIEIPLDEDAPPNSTWQDLLGQGSVRATDGVLRVTLPPKGFGFYGWTV